MISGVHHLAIKVRDLALAERFYVGVLGLTVLRRWPATDGTTGERSLWLGLDPAGLPAGLDDESDPDGTFLALETLAPGAVAVTGGPRPEQPGHHLVAFRIRREQRGACEARLVAAGVAITHRTAYTLYFHDPEGNRLGLSHHPDPAESG